MKGNLEINLSNFYIATADIQHREIYRSTDLLYNSEKVTLQPPITYDITDELLIPHKDIKNEIIFDDLRFDDNISNTSKFLKQYTITKYTLTPKRQLKVVIHMLEIEKAHIMLKESHLLFIIY